MSVAQAAAPPDRGVSPLMSNNPFRNKVTNSSTSPTDPPRGRPLSTNPFLDVTEVSKESAQMNKTSTAPDTSVNKAAVIFDKLEIKDSTTSQRGPPRRPNDGPPRRPENVPPPGMRRPPPPGHRPSTSEEERRRRMQGRPRGDLDIFADPPDAQKLRERRPRRNSESSVRDRTTKLLDPEEEKKRQERKRRESKRAGPKSGKPNRRLDVIDKLDVTSIYGTGLFHHDGPFDACNPHRNRKKERFAPMQAFPKDSTNMIVGGSGPVNKRMDYDKFHGVGQEAHIDYNEAAIADENITNPARRPHPERNASFNPMTQEEIHGDESAGLGTSTFLEGAPASRAAIQRRESEYEIAQIGREGAPGLSRKKSLAQKLRSVRPNRERFASPDGARSPPVSPPITGQSDSGINPFFESFDKEPEQKIAEVEPEQETTGRSRAPSSPMRLNLERRNTTQADSPGEQANGKPAGGFLGRMKSLKSSSKPRPARRDTSG